MSLSRLTSRELHENQHDANWLVMESSFYGGHFSEVQGFSGVDSLRQECVSFQTLGKKFSHVKTATNYGGSVKALMKGGDLLIESCGCALFLKIKQHVLCTHIPHDTQTRGALWLLPLKQRCLLHTLFRAWTLFLENVNMKCYLMVNHDLRAKTLTLLIFLFFWKSWKYFGFKGNTCRDLKNLPSCDWDISIKQHAIARRAVTASNLICKDEYYYSKMRLGGKKRCYNTNLAYFIWVSSASEKSSH